LRKMVSRMLFIIALLILMVMSVVCGYPNGIEISEGPAPQREETYDDIINCGPGSDNYRANCTPQQRALPSSIEETKADLSGCIFAPCVRYRDNIETESGEIRYNLFYFNLKNEFLRAISRIIVYPLTKSSIVHYDLKLMGTSQYFNIKNVGELCYGGYGCPYGDKQVNLMIEIPTDVKQGDYTLNFIVEANGRYCGELPCVIHVIE
jgi:hypothetical protein